MNLPTPESLREILTFDEDSGRLLKGGVAIARPVAQGRYLAVSVLGVSISEHIAIWAIKTGKYPRQSIDHINRDGTDNRWANL